MNEFVQAYIECAIWSSTDNEGNPLDSSKNADNIAVDTLARMEADCAAFELTYGELIADNPARAGHDFWLTRNGHGAGFWDGDWPEHGDTLTDASHKFGEYSLYIGDDGSVYGMNG